MSKAADISEPVSELEHLMADLPGWGSGSSFSATILPSRT